MARNRKIEARLAAVQRALADGRPFDALALSRELLLAAPRDAAVLNMAGIASFQTGDGDSARRLLEDAAARAPGDADVRMNLGNVLAAAGAFEDALAAYDAAGDGPEPLYNAGLMLMRAGRHTEALDRFRRAREAAREHAGAALGEAEALRQSGRPADARRLLNEIVAARPDDAAAHVNLSAVALELGDKPAALEHAEKAARLAPGMIEAEFNLGVALQASGDADAAVRQYRRVLALAPGHAAAALNQGETYLSMGDTENAGRSFARALEIDPGFAKAAVNRADLDLVQGDPAAAITGIDAYLRRRPGQPLALAFKAAALWENGNDDAARALVDMDRLLAVTDISPPSGFASLSDFNAALVQHVLEHPSLTPSPESHATRHGRHSGELLAEPMGPIADLSRLIRDAATAYVRERPRDPSHPFLADVPDAIEGLGLSIWGVVMERDGHQIPHIHPAAWLSGVYYADVPPGIGDGVRDDGSDTYLSGWIEFGRPPGDFHLRRPPEVRNLKPAPGRLILFPSYLYHRTIPLAVDAFRVSIAFDLITGHYFDHD